MKFSQLIFVIIVSLNVFPVYSQTDKDIVNECFKQAGDDVIYLQDFIVELPGVSAGDRPPISKKSILLRKNITYRFTICNREDSEGEGIIQLFDTRRMVGSSYNPKTGKTYKSFNFSCAKSGPYTIFISFKEGKKGSTVGILSYVKKSLP